MLVSRRLQQLARHINAIRLFADLLDGLLWNGNLKLKVCANCSNDEVAASRTEGGPKAGTPGALTFPGGIKLSCRDRQDKCAGGYEPDRHPPAHAHTRR